MNLKLTYEQQWLSQLSIEVQIIISKKANKTFLFDLEITQEIIGDLNEQATLGLEVVQYNGMPPQNNYGPSILLARIDWKLFGLKHLVTELFYNDMLLLLSIDEEEVPEFFGPKLQELIRGYAKGGPFEAHIIFEIPRYHGKKIIPATHHILLSKSRSHWNSYTIGPFQLHHAYTNSTHYFVDFKGPTDDWELLAETLTAKV